MPKGFCGQAEFNEEDDLRKRGLVGCCVPMRVVTNEFWRELPYVMHDDDPLKIYLSPRERHNQYIVIIVDIVQGRGDFEA